MDHPQHTEIFYLVHTIDFIIAMVFLHQFTTTWLSSTSVKIVDGNPWEEFSIALRRDRNSFFLFGIVLTLIMGQVDDWMISPIFAALGFLLPVYIDNILDIKKMRKG